MPKGIFCLSDNTVGLYISGRWSLIHNFRGAVLISFSPCETYWCIQWPRGRLFSEYVYLPPSV